MTAEPMGGHGSVGEHIDSFDMPARVLLRHLRELSRAAAPDATEALKWGDPAYVHEDGVILFLFSGFKAHANFVFTPSTRQAFSDELAGSVPARGRSSFRTQLRPLTICSRG